MKTNRIFILFPALCLFAGLTSCSKGDENTPDPSNIIKDTAVTIERKATHYLVTLDLTQGFSHYRIGQQYGRCINKMVPNYETILGSHLSILAFIQSVDSSAVPERINNIRPQLDADFRDELDGIVSQFKGTANWSAFEIVYGGNLVPDVFRPAQCCAFGCWGTASKTGDNIAYRTLDWPGSPDLCSIQTITKVKHPDKTIFLIGMLGQLGCVTGINNQTSIMAAILDADVETSHQSPGRRSYSFDLRKALESETTKEGIAGYLKKPEFGYTWDHLIFLADKTDCIILENNISNAGPVPQRAIRTDKSSLNQDIPWNFTDMIGAVNCFMLSGQFNNYSEGVNGPINTERWGLLCKKSDSLRQLNNNQLSDEHVREIMCSYWGSEPRSLYAGGGDLYNKDTQQMFWYIPAQRSLRVFFKPKNNIVPNDPSKFFETIDLLN
ncbi:MAG: C45 family autoproteolytic acyltransferase/hydrolase [Bacteroidales bacterium]|jgi:hypothetical protein|nr:C45 family autoproteolytic acyltransferase/hydrolase [Bacteroidales bacterium]